MASHRATAIVTARSGTSAATVNPVPLVGRLLAEREAFLGFVRSRVSNMDDAEDVLQHALMKASHRAEDLREPDAARAWFFRILRRTIADHLEERARQVAKQQAIAAIAPEPTTPKPSVCCCTVGLLDRLRPEYAEVLRRVDMGDESLPEVAITLGIRVENATVRLHRARRALREELALVCGTRSMRACLSCNCDA